VTRADKRARQKEGSRQAKEAREAAQKRERRKSMAIRFGVSLVIVAILIGLTALFTNNKKDNSNANATTSSSVATTTPTTAVPAVLPAGCVDTVPPANPNRPTSFKSAPPMTIDTAKTYTAKLSTSCGDITVALDAKGAPTSVNNFVFLAKQGFYDGLKWPRAVGNFVIQTGSPSDDQNGGPGYSVKTEVPAQAGYAAGAVAWAKGGSEPAGTAGSQFFVVTGSGGSTLAADYGTIGTVSTGLENAQKIASLAPDGGTGDGPPAIPMYLFKVEITES
jgi:peptidyl-prolyl cis-trans isomerase B (cyclophilin B)